MNRTAPNPFMPTAETIAKYSRRVEKAEVPAKTLLTRAYRAQLHARGLTSKGKPYIRDAMKKRYAAG